MALEIEEENFRVLKRNTRHLPQVTAVRRAAMVAMAGRGFVVAKRGQYTVFWRGGR